MTHPSLVGASLGSGGLMRDTVTFRGDPRELAAFLLGTEPSKIGVYPPRGTVSKLACRCVEVTKWRGERVYLTIRESEAGWTVCHRSAYRGHCPAIRPWGTRYPTAEDLVRAAQASGAAIEIVSAVDTVLTQKHRKGDTP